MIYGRNDTIPTVNISNYNGLGASNVNWNNFNRLFNFKDDFSKLLGNHNLKLGFLAMRSRKNQDNWPAVNGTVGYSTGHSNSTGNAFGDALIGNFATYTEANTNREGWYRFTQVEGYVQDDWKINARLTVNLGFRYQYMPPQYCALMNCVMWLPQYWSASKAPRIATLEWRHHLRHGRSVQRPDARRHGVSGSRQTAHRPDQRSGRESAVPRHSRAPG